MQGNTYEIQFAVGTLAYHTRKMIINVYLPPDLGAARTREQLEYIGLSIIDLKCRFKDPFFIIGGDFNRRDIDGILADFPDLMLVPAGGTRDGVALDKLFTNFGPDIFEHGTLAPLESESGTVSDHDVVYASSYLKREQTFTWITYSYLQYREESAVEFKNWLSQMDWQELFAAKTSSEKAEIYNRECDDAVKRFFPVVTVKRKSTDNPWIRKQLRQRAKIFRKEGRSSLWKKMKKKTFNLMRKRQTSITKNREPLCLPKTPTDISTIMSEHLRTLRSRLHGMSGNLRRANRTRPWPMTWRLISTELVTSSLRWKKKKYRVLTIATFHSFKNTK